MGFLRGTGFASTEGSKGTMTRREFLQVSALGAAALAAGTLFATARGIPNPSKPVHRVKPFEFEEATCLDLQAAMRSGRETSVSITRKYLDRIADLDKRGPALNAVIEINPDAIAIARALDRERKERGPRGPLHGVPILLKDNFDTHDRMM